MLRVEKICKKFGGVVALDHCSFEIEKGIITALIGPNGSGKSTIFNVISRLVQEDSGNIFFEGENVTHFSDVDLSRKGISRTFQDVRLFRNLTIADHLEIALAENDEKLVSGLFTRRHEHNGRIKEILALVDLAKSPHTLATDLSYGQRRLLDLAIALAKPHQLLMLDEPVAGVNPLLRGEIKAILKKLRAQGETILVIEHDMNFVMDLAERVLVMDQGGVIAQGTAREIQKNPLVLSAYLGEA